MKTGTLDHRRPGVAFAAVAFAALAAALMALTLLAAPALADTFAVDRTDDSAVASACTAAANDCSLRGAIIAANAAGGADIINVPAGDYDLSILGANEDSSLTGDLDINNDNVDIVGAGARTTTIDAGGIDRVFHIPSGAHTVSISGVTVKGGEVVGDGGGISTSFSNSGLTLTNVAVTGNTAEGNGDGTGGTGGGIYFYAGTLNITKSTISGNTAEGDNAPGSGGGGGGIYVDDGDISITNSTISGNAAENGTVIGSDGRGGGIFNSNQALVDLLNVTVNANEATDGDNIYNGDVEHVFTLKNTIVANPVSGDNCGGILVTSVGNNIDEDDTCFTNIAPTDIFQDPNLAALANNTGPTNTHALLTVSPAINAANTAAAPATDQRGVARPQPAGGRADIGAFELKVNDGGGGGGGGGGNNPPKPHKPKPSNACTIKGTPASDILRGTPRRDVICGRAGDDIIRGEGGNDLLLGNSGNDVIRGDGGKDAAIGGRGRDIVSGNGGNDRLNVRDGIRANETIDGGPGRDVCISDRVDIRTDCP